MNNVSQLFDNVCIGKLNAYDMKCFSVINLHEDNLSLQSTSKRNTCTVSIALLLLEAIIYGMLRRV